MGYGRGARTRTVAQMSQRLRSLVLPGMVPVSLASSYRGSPNAMLCRRERRFERHRSTPPWATLVGFESTTSPVTGSRRICTSDPSKQNSAGRGTCKASRCVPAPSIEHVVWRLSGSRASFSQFDARLVSIAELYSRHLQGLLDDLERCSARSCFSKLEYPDGRNSNAGCLGELLLIPVKQGASCSAAGISMFRLWGNYTREYITQSERPYSEFSTS
jgi:hypothetical protein